MTTGTQAVAPLLVFGWGNPGRGDDALGPLLVEQLSARLGADAHSAVECLTDFQLQVEHALDLVGRARVLFVDASVRVQAPFEVSALLPAQGASVASHALSPAALLQVFCQLERRSPPPCTLLAIRADQFELGQPPSPAALSNLAAALAWTQAWLAPHGPSGKPPTLI